MKQPASKGTVVLVDDDPKLRRLYTDFLSAKGYTVMPARDGTEGLNLITRITPKLVLLDIMMPGLDGIETCRRMREVLGPRVPIMFLTSLDSAERLREGLQAGGDDYLLKSGRLNVILDRIQSWNGWEKRGKAESRRSQALQDVDMMLSGEFDPSAQAVADGRSVDNSAAHSTEPAKPAEIVEPAPEAAELEFVDESFIVDLKDFVRRALAAAGDEFGKDRSQSLFFLGYVAGLVDFEIKQRGDLKPNFRSYVRETLRETGVIKDGQVEVLLGSLDTLTANEVVRNGWVAGHHDRAQATTIGPAFEPEGLAAAYKASA